MEETKKIVYEILETLPNAVIYEERPEIINVLPNQVVVAYQLADDIPFYMLDKGIAFQFVTVSVDIYARTSKEATQKLIALEELMRSENYLLVSNVSLGDPMYAHINARFTNYY
jgi:hypothetical protein